jgi:membrane protease YdiL (CAAX protease family)
LRRIAARALALVLLPSMGALADEHVRPETAARWSLLCPGCGYFYLGRTGTASAYLGTAVALAGTGAALLWDGPDLGNPADPTLGPDDPIGLQLLLAAQNVWFYGVFASYRDARALRPDLRYRVPVSGEGLGDLASAPFRGSVLSRPWVWAGVPVAVGAALGLTAIVESGLGGRRTLFDDGGVNFLGQTYDRGPGIALGELYFATMFVPVAVGEEGLFRGTLQPVLRERAGTTAGWALTSALFGAAHIPNYLGEDPGTAAAAVSYITVLGGYLGAASIGTGGALSTPVAIHFWYDFLLSTALFVADPDHQPFVAGISGLL